MLSYAWRISSAETVALEIRARPHACVQVHIYMSRDTQHLNWKMRAVVLLVVLAQVVSVSSRAFSHHNHQDFRRLAPANIPQFRGPTEAGQESDENNHRGAAVQYTDDGKQNPPFAMPDETLAALVAPLQQHVLHSLLGANDTQAPDLNPTPLNTNVSGVFHIPQEEHLTPSEAAQADAILRGAVHIDDILVPETMEGMLASVPSNVSGRVFVKQDAVMDYGVSGEIEVMIHRTMSFSGSFDPVSVVRCLPTADTATDLDEHVCCGVRTPIPCCQPDTTHLADGYPGLSLLALPLHTAIASQPPRTVAVVGMGGGPVPTHILGNFPDITVTVVEPDEAVAAAAMGYFGVCPGPKLEIITTEPDEYFLRCFPATPTTPTPNTTATYSCPNSKFDVIFFDVRQHNEIPPPLLSKLFISSLAAALSPKGVLAFHVMSLSPNKVRSISGMLRKTFPEFSLVTQMPLEHNAVLFSAAMDRRQSAEFRVDGFHNITEALVANGQLPQVLQLVAESPHFLRVVESRAALNATLPAEHPLTWHGHSHDSPPRNSP